MKGRIWWLALVLSLGPVESVQSMPLRQDRPSNMWRQTAKLAVLICSARCFLILCEPVILRHIKNDIIFGAAPFSQKLSVTLFCGVCFLMGYQILRRVKLLIYPLVA